MSDQTLYTWFADAARQNPDAVALEVRGRSLTYRELRAASDRMAHRIEQATGGADGIRIGLFAARSPLAYIGYLAIIRIGAAVVPLNPLYPSERNGFIADKAGLTVVIGDDSLTGDWTHSRRVLTGVTSRGAPGEYTGRADDVAYILFTSGSTGTPKGLPIRHRNVSPYLAYNIDRYGVQPGCRLSQTFDLTFDPSVFDMFVTWGAGATLVVPQRDDLNDPAHFVARERLTHWFSVPSVASLAARMRRLTPGSMPDLRWSLFAGEQLTLEQARAWAGAAPTSRIENIYGPTELTVTCTGYRLPADPAQWPRTANGTVPIGYCYPHLQHVVLSGGKPCTEGELCVRGPQRFDGYLDEDNNPGRFLTHNPANGTPAQHYDGTSPLTAGHWYRTGDRVSVGPDGAMLHLGRLDSQVQVHGYRVELGDIEANLRAHPEIDEAAVLVHDGELRAIYTGTTTLATGTLVDWLAARVPAYMVPRTYTFVDLMPRNDNGKLDRGRLEAIPC